MTKSELQALCEGFNVDPGAENWLQGLKIAVDNAIKQSKKLRKHLEETAHEIRKVENAESKIQNDS